MSWFFHLLFWPVAIIVGGLFILTQIGVVVIAVEDLHAEEKCKTLGYATQNRLEESDDVFLCISADGTSTLKVSRSR